MSTRTPLLLAASLLVLSCLLLAAPVLAQGMQSTATVSRVFMQDGAVHFESSQGVFELDYEAGVEANEAAMRTLQALAGTGKAVSFSYFTEGGRRILTKASVASLAWMKH